MLVCYKNETLGFSRPFWIFTVKKAVRDCFYTLLTKGTKGREESLVR